MVAITGNVPIALLGKDSFQEVDITGITMPITKHNFIVKDVNRLADTIRQAFYIAQSGRPGPVLVDIPRDISVALSDYIKTPPRTITRDDSASDAALEEAVQILSKAQRPLIYSGGGVITSGASEKLAEFARLIDANVCVSAMGIGGFSATSEQFIGMIGMHGTATANTLATECDLIIAIGARFSDRVVSNVKRFAPSAQVLHIDIDAAEINKNILTTHSLIGDLKSVLSRLNALLSPQDRSDWRNRAKALKTEFPLRYKANNETLKPQYIIQRISALAANKAIITTEVGQHQMWSCQYLQIEQPRRFLTSGGLGTMGFGLGASIGAAIGNSGTPVINIAGDGCFRMNNIELATAVEYNLPVIVVIINNHALGMVRQWQNMFFDKRYSHTSLHTKTTDFIKLAEAYGAMAINVDKPTDVDNAITRALDAKQTVVINFEVGDDDNVFPMVPPGAGIDEYILEGE